MTGMDEFFLRQVLAQCCPLLMPIAFRKAATEGLRYGQ